MTYAGTPYAGGAYAGAGMLGADIPVETEPRNFAVEVSFTTDALATPAWVDISADVRSWDTTRGRSRELERFRTGRATIVLDNSSRAYDSQHATGPWFGNLRPMRRIRIRETFNGVTYPRFDGFVDRWQLDTTHVDSTVTVDATDAFKIFARTELPRSVYAGEVDADSPVIWWRLNESVAEAAETAAALNEGSLLTVGDGTYVSPHGLEDLALIVNDAGGSMLSIRGDTLEVSVDRGVTIATADFDLAATASWAVEMWVLVDDSPPAASSTRFWTRGPSATQTAVMGTTGSAGSDPGQFTFLMLNSVGTLFGVAHPTTLAQGGIFHVVCKLGPSNQMTIYVNGVASTTLATGASSTVFSGTHTLGVDFGAAYTFGNFLNPGCRMSNVAIYTGAVGTDVLSAARVSAHYAAGTSPWQGDLPGARAGRVLDEADWPNDLRELDAGQTTFQSADFDGGSQTVLEHLHKVSETEFGNMFVTRAGVVRLIARDPLDDRVSQATFGDKSHDRFVDLPGTSGNYISTPDSAAVSITGDIDIRVMTAAVTQSTLDVFLSKWGSGTRTYLLRLTSFDADRLEFAWVETAGASRSVFSSALPPLDAPIWLRVTLDVDDGAGGHAVTFYTSSDGVAWTPLGSPGSAGAFTTSIRDTTAEVRLGGEQETSGRELNGDIYGAEIRNGIDGPVVAVFDAEDPAEVLVGQRAPATVTSSQTGEVWTINGSSWVWSEDATGEVGYRRVTFADGDVTIRNRVTISRLNGVARTAVDADSVAEFGRFQYTLDGLLHNTEAHSIAYAQTIVDSFHEPARRVVALELGPAAAGAETALYEQMLGRELGDVVTVKVRHPDGTGAVFTQDVVIEEMADRWDPHSFRTATWTLGAEPPDTSF